MRRLFYILTFVLLASTSSATTYYYWDPDASGSNDGSSWANAWETWSDVRSESAAIETAALSDDIVICLKKGSDQELPTGVPIIIDFGGSTSTNTVTLGVHPSDTGATPRLSQYDALQTGSGNAGYTTTTRWEGLIDFRDGAQFFVLSDIDLEYPVGRGIRFNSTASWVNMPGVIVDNVSITSSGKSAIYIHRTSGTSDDRLVIKNCTFTQNVRAGNWSTYRDDYPISETDHPGTVMVDEGSSYFSFESNTVYENYGEGLAATQYSHHGIIQDNYIYNQAVSIYVDGSHDIVIRRNQTYGSNEQFGYSYRDAGGESWNGGEIWIATEEYGFGSNEYVYNISIYNNLLVNSRYGVSIAPNDGGQDEFNLNNIYVRYNTFINNYTAFRFACADSGPVFTTSNLYFKNNLIWAASGFPHILPMTFEGIAETTQVAINNNAFPNPSGISIYGTAYQTSNNGFTDVSNTWAEITDGTNIPTLYPDATFSRITSASTAIGNAQNTCGNYTPDLLSVVRPQGGGCDIGATEEYSGSPPAVIDSIYDHCSLKGLYKGIYK